MPSFKFLFDDNPAIDTIVGMCVKVVKKGGTATKVRRVVIDSSEARRQQLDDGTGTLVPKWVLRLKRATGGRVKAHVISVIVYDGTGKAIDQFIRRYAVSTGSLAAKSEGDEA